MRRNARAAGFTLLEVMISLAILAGALTVLIQITASSTRASLRAAKLTMAVGLTRGKMYDLEEELLHEGFQDTSEELEGDFSEEGHADFKWQATVEKIELPSAAQLQNALGAADSAGGEAPADGEAAAPGGLAGLLGGGGGSMAGASVLVSQFDLIRGVMEGALRKVTLTVTWSVGRDPEELTVVCYFTDPKSVDEAVGAAAAGAAEEEPQGPGGQPTTPGGGGGGGGDRGGGTSGGGNPAGGRR